MRKVAAALVLLGSLALSSCLAGPHQLRRTVDDWDQKMYVNSPWVDAVLWVVPVFPLANFVAWAGDFIIGDLYAFWFKDAWDGKGTAFTHYQVTPTDGAMKSLLIDDAKFIEIR